MGLMLSMSFQVFFGEWLVGKQNFGDWLVGKLVLVVSISDKAFGVYVNTHEFCTATCNVIIIVGCVL